MEAESGDLFTGLWDALQVVLGEIALLAESPWQFQLYSDSTGTPPLPVDLIAKMEQIGKLDVMSADTFRAAIEIVQSLAQLSSDTSGGAGDVTGELVERFVLPISVVAMRETDHWLLYSLLSGLMFLDDKLAENAPGFTAGLGSPRPRRPRITRRSMIKTA